MSFRNAASIPPPPPTWMHKARSQNTGGGFFSKLRTSGSWNRRYVQIDGTTVAYGPEPSQKEKVIPFETITKVKGANTQAVIEQGGPEQFAPFGIEFVTDKKSIIFVCESAAARDAWLSYFEALLESMTSAGAAAAEPAQTMAMRAAAAEKAPTSHHSEDGDDTRSVMDDAGEWGTTAVKSQKELRRLAGEDDDDDELNWDNSLGDDDDDDDDVDSDAEDGEKGGIEASKFVSAQAAYQKQLLPIAQHAYNHIAFKLDAYKGSFRPDDNVRNVLFSRSIQKIAKKDNIHDRDLVLTSGYLYLFTQGTFGSVKVRAVNVDQIIGVLESTVEPNLFALLVPSFHDILIRIHAQKSVIGGSEVEVKQQLLAHLYILKNKLDQTFIFREADNVRGLIRRTEEDAHQPLESKELDRLQVGLNPKVFVSFRINAESVCHFSTMVERVNAQMGHSSRIFAITDGGVYLLPADGSRVSKRCSLNEIAQIKYDGDTQHILLQLAEYDWLISIPRPADFENIIRVVPAVAAQCGRPGLPCIPAKSLLSGVRLLEPKKLSEHLGKAGATTEEGIKKGMKLTQKMLQKSWKFATQSTTTVGKTFLGATRATLELGKTGLTSVGGVLLDNVVMDNMLGMTGMMFAQQRIVFERIITLQDQENAIRLTSPRHDILKLHSTPTATNNKLGGVLYSSRCKRFNITAHIEQSKTQDQVVVICERGVMIFDDPTATQTSLLGSALSVLRSDKGYNLDERVKWTELRGVIRCLSEPNIIGITVTDERSTDLMVRIPNSAFTEQFVAHFCRMFRAANGRLPHVHNSDSVDMLRTALKKTTFDPEPSLGLRRHRISDQLLIASSPEIIETIRRHGDNKVMFSGVAWRFRSSSVKQGGDAMGAKLDDHGKCAEDKKSFKSFVLIVTNCAIYMCTKGSMEIQRRTEVTHVKKVITSQNDPDALLIVVPDEYDIFCRVEGRAKELVERLQDVYADWTNYSLYLPHEQKNSHDLTRYVFPTESAANLVTAGNLVKPTWFNEAQAKRSAADVHKRYRLWFQKDLALALGGETKAASTWAEEEERYQVRIARVRHAVERAFVFGIRSSEMRQMDEALEMLKTSAARGEVINALKAALAMDDIDKYDEALEKSFDHSGLELLVEEQEATYAALKRKKEVTDRIKKLLAEEEGDDGDIESKLGQLDADFAEAERLQVRPALVTQLKQDVDKRIQRQRLARQLRITRNPNRFNAQTRSLLIAAAESLEVSSTIRQSIIDTGVNPMVKWGQVLLESAMSSGNERTLTDAIVSVQKEAEVAAELKSGPLAEAEEQLKVLKAKHATILELTRQCEDLRRNINGYSAAQLHVASGKLREYRKVLGTKHVVLQRAQNLGSLYASRIRDRLDVLELVEQKQTREAAAQAEYRSRVAENDRLQRQALEEEKRKELEVQKQRRKVLLDEWSAHAERLLYGMKQHVSADDSHAVNTCATQCNAALDEQAAAFGRFSPEEKAAFEAAFEKINDKLQTAIKVGRGYSEHKKRKAHTLPDTVVTAIQKLNKANVIAYIKANQGRTLTPQLIEEIRREWVKAAAEARWVAQLHHHIHTAVALGNIDMLCEQLELARAKGNYTDAVVTDAKEWLVAQRAKEPEEGGDGSPSPSAAGPSSALNDETLLKTPTKPKAKPVLYDLMYAWQPRETKGVAMFALHAALRNLLTNPDNTAEEHGKVGLHCDCTHPDVKTVADAWLAVLGHRIKPSGIFRKTERTIVDAISCIGKLTRGGNIVAPFCMHLEGEFERIKKLNNPHGLSPSQMFTRFIISKNDIERLLDDFFRLLPKEAEDIFLEDSLFRCPNEGMQKDLRLMAKMTAQAIWDFHFTEKTDTPARGQMPDASPEKISDITPAMAVTSLRNSVSRLSHMFTIEMRKLGSRPDAKALKSIFDENVNKAVGLTVRESVCPSIAQLLLVGFKPTNFGFKRYLWELLEAVSDRLKQSARGIGGVGIPDAVDMVKSITDTSANKGRHSALSKMSYGEVNEVLLRMFLAHALNQNCLLQFLEAIYEDNPANVEFLKKYYHTERTVAMLNRQVRVEVDRVLKQLDALPFVLCIDAEIW